ncbi:hypothetical protein PN498_01060 [Oscillatoria sp. CS-180]|uniref:hypothetical protein n=1 Tax=Oscillatoria sp. CS-180 TaxID=3021720 RepID=UPI00232ED3CF|nr:hypothetical protein [Oscillatoria sp. CS-180]MDB9524562.1 hypothetical protein [Oscillatoria sp. CS-180]
METSENEFLNSLELLIPWELPLDQHLSPADRLRIGRALEQLSEALVESSPQRSLDTINQALTNLGEIKTQKTGIRSTKTALKAWEVEDYDRYFQICHVQTDQSAVCLVRGLLVACQRFFEICLQTPWLETQFIQQQRKGFLSYVHLLKRIFDLDELD